MSTVSTTYVLGDGRKVEVTSYMDNHIDTRTGQIDRVTVEKRVVSGPDLCDEELRAVAEWAASGFRASSRPEFMA
jgi:hypothetical protein